MEISSTAIIIGIEHHSERFDKVHVFEEEEGYLCLLKRKSTKKMARNNLDLFETVELSFQRKTSNDIGFIKESTQIKSHTNIGKSYDAFDYASKFCRAIHLNAKHMANPPGVYELIELSLDAWNHKPNPEITYFKAIYRLASEDGFPVKEDWLQRLKKADFIFAKSVLFQPVDSQKTPKKQLIPLADDLIHWLTHQQDFVF